MLRQFGGFGSGSSTPVFAPLADGGEKTDSFASAAGYLYRINLSTPPTDTFTRSGNTIVWATKTPVDGMLVRVASATTLPSGLTASTNYWTVSSSGSACGLALTPGGSAVALSSAGTGTHTVTYSPCITFPISPGVGDTFGYMLARSHSIYCAYPYRNGSSIGGLASVVGQDKYLLYIQGEQLVWRYDSTSSGVGWTQLGEGRIPCVGRVYRNAAQTMVDVTWVKISHDTVAIDNASLWNATNKNFGIRRANEYLVGIRHHQALNDGKQIQIAVVPADAIANLLGYGSRTGAKASEGCPAHIFEPMTFAAGATLFHYANPNTGGNLDTDTTAHQRPTFWIQELLV